MGFREFVADVGRRDARVTVVDRRSEPPVYRLLVGLFDTDAVTVREAESGDDSHPPDSTVLRTGDGSEAVAVSSLGAVRDELLLMNSDIYRTGARDLDDVDPPDVIAGLDGVPFRVRSDVRQPKAKLVLIEMSRAIEAMAWRDGTGRLDAGFQHLSRIADERGTRRVYAQLGAETDVETTVYGASGPGPSLPSVAVRTADAPELERSWFVVYWSAEQPDHTAALIAVQGDDEWTGCWTTASPRCCGTSTGPTGRRAGPVGPQPTSAPDRRPGGRLRERGSNTPGFAPSMTAARSRGCRGRRT